MATFEFYVQIEDALTGQRLGAPLKSVTSWAYTARFDRAGSIAFSFDASDPSAGQVTNTRVARAFALLGGVWTEVGAGIIDDVSVTPSAEGRTTITAQGLDLIRELSYRSVGALEIGKPNGALHSVALTVLSAYAPPVPGWIFTPAADPANDYIYARYDGESLLGALIYLAEKTGTHFYRGPGRQLIFADSFTDSGVRAIGGTRSLGANRCLINSISQRVDTHDLLTRIYPYGSGEGRARLTLASSNRTAPPGYVLNKTQNFIENTAATALYGLRDFPAFDYKEITPISNTAANKRAASNMLFDSALMELQRRSLIALQNTYELTLEGCNELLRPMQKVRVTYRDPDQGMDIDEDLGILEATWTATPGGIVTSSLVVSTDDRWPESDASAAAERAVQGRVFQAHPQLGPNSYWENGTLYVGSDQANHIAEFPFVLGPEVATIDRVRFRFKVTEPLSFTSTVATTSTTSDPSSETSSGSSSKTTSDASSKTSSDASSATVTAGGGAEATLPVSPSSTDDSSGPNGIYGSNTGSVTTPTAGTMHSHPIPHNHSIVHNHTLTLAAHTHPMPHNHGIAHDHGMDHSHGINHTHAVTPVVVTAYGVYRAPASRTFDMSELEYAINGSAWIALDTAIPTGDYYEIDLTAAVQDPETFTPLQENNLLEIRRAEGASSIAINSSLGYTTKVGISTEAAHALAVGDQVTITGTTHHNGTWEVVELQSATVFFTNQTGDLNAGVGGSVLVNKSAMIYVKLGVVDFIQAVAIIG